MSDQAAREAWLLMSDAVLANSRRREVSEALGMSFSRVRAIRRIAAREMSMGELGTLLGIDRPNVTVLVDDLESRGLVRRTQHPTDRRAKIVQATAEGREEARRADEILATPPERLVALGDDELAALRDLLRKAFG